MKLYDGGSDKDDMLISVTTRSSAPSQVTSSRNQIFIMFTTDNNGIGKGFTTKISFGMLITKW